MIGNIGPRPLLAALAGLALVLGSCDRGVPSADAQLPDDSNGSDWAGYGRTFGQQHYSPLSEIDAGSGAMLGEKIGAIDGLAGVDVIIAGDASCLMHINGGLSRRGSKRRVVHLAEALTGRIGLQP